MQDARNLVRAMLAFQIWDFVTTLVTKELCASTTYKDCLHTANVNDYCDYPFCKDPIFTFVCLPSKFIICAQSTAGANVIYPRKIGLSERGKASP